LHAKPGKYGSDVTEKELNNLLEVYDSSSKTFNTLVSTEVFD